jgi:hypothetical protein
LTLFFLPLSSSYSKLKRDSKEIPKKLMNLEYLLGRTQREFHTRELTEKLPSSKVEGAYLYRDLKTTFMV